jgi:hypothetical protein
MEIATSPRRDLARYTFEDERFLKLTKVLEISSYPFPDGAEAEPAPEPEPEHQASGEKESADSEPEPEAASQDDHNAGSHVAAATPVVLSLAMFAFVRA